MTSSYSLAGTAVAESFWSVSVSLPLVSTGLVKNTLASASVPPPGFVAPAVAASTSPSSTAPIVIRNRISPPLGSLRARA